MEAKWREHTLSVRGDWTAKWLFLAPQYELWIDDKQLATSGGPRMSHRMEAIYEDEAGERHLVSATLTSIIGFRPMCELSVGEQLLKADRVRVDNFINPILILFIIAAVSVMFWVGPQVLRQHMPGADYISIGKG
jgi:hypothetical protein